MEHIYALSDEEFQEAVQNAESLTEILRNFSPEYLSLPYTHLNLRIKLLGISTKHFRKFKVRRVEMGQVFCRDSKASKGTVKSYARLHDLVAYKCAFCGLEPEMGQVEIVWMGKPLYLELDHINGIKTDNRVENLRFLCHFCHSQTATFCGRNITRRDRHWGEVPKELLVEAINSAHSIREAVVSLGFADCAMSYSGFYKRIHKEQLDLSPIILRGKDRADTFKHQRTACVVCGKPRCPKSKSGKCLECYSNERKLQKQSRPSAATLLEDVKNLGYAGTGRKFGVCDNTIKKWLRDYGQKPQSRRYTRWTEDNTPCLSEVRDCIARGGYAEAQKQWLVDRKTVRKWFIDAGEDLPKKN